MYANIETMKGAGIPVELRQESRRQHSKRGCPETEAYLYKPQHPQLEQTNRSRLSAARQLVVLSQYTSVPVSNPREG